MPSAESYTNKTRPQYRQANSKFSRTGASKKEGASETRGGKVPLQVAKSWK